MIKKNNSFPYDNYFAIDYSGKTRWRTNNQKQRSPLTNSNHFFFFSFPSRHEKCYRDCLPRMEPVDFGDSVHCFILWFRYSISTLGTCQVNTEEMEAYHVAQYIGHHYWDSKLLGNVSFPPSLFFF